MSTPSTCDCRWPLYSVRGFKEQLLSGNCGAYWRNAVNWQLAHFPSRVRYCSPGRCMVTESAVMED
ncbi:MAG: ShlB/FhaC/HecB family hemolysin secretion/activation protein [Candidatus Malihini olakiniferum]